MGVTLGWLAVALAASGPASAPEKPQPEITYHFQMVEVRGLAWRDAGQGLRPVAQHSAVSVWTAHGDFLQSLPKEARSVATANAKVKGLALSPAHLTTRKDQAFITKVSWKGDGKTPKQVVENVREGVAATVVGRKLDQGVLVQLVIDDTDIRSVHTIDSPSPKHAAKVVDAGVKVVSADDSNAQTCTVAVTASMDSSAPTDSEVKATSGVSACHARSCPLTEAAACCDADANQAGWLPSKAATVAAQSKSTSSCNWSEEVAEAKIDDQAVKTSWKPATGAQIQIPEIGRASASGEWLIPEDGVLVIGFGPHTVADADGKAVVREHLAVITAEVEDVADADIEADAPTSSPDAGSAPYVLPPHSVIPVAPRTAVAIPSLPSRTMPQGVHSDGRPAVLPPLPEEEKAEAVSDEPSKPLPSPQIKRKPAPPTEASPTPAAEAPSPEAEAAVPESKVDDEEAKTPKPIDQKIKKTSFTFPPLSAFTPLAALKSTGAFPVPFQGAQFLVPLKPFALKLPFNQKLEIELLGRIVNDPDARETHVVAEN